MVDEFLKEFYNLLRSKPYSGIDISPLVNKYTDGKDNNETSVIRLRIRNIIDQLKEAKLIEPVTNYYFQLAIGFTEQYLQDPIIIKSTLKFKQEHKNNSTVQPITNNTINVGTNSGEIMQDFESSDLDKGTKTSIGKFIMDNIGVIITTVIGGLIVGYILHILGWV